MLVGEKIKKLRELKNYGQDYMADKLGITQGAYSKLESGETDVPYSRLEQIAEVLGIRPEDIIAFNEHMVFNVMHNQTGNGLVIHNQISQTEKKLFEDLIETQKKEIEHLKSVLDKILLSDKK